MGYAVDLAVAGDVFAGVFLYCPFSHETSWMRSGTLLSQFLRVFLPTFTLSEATLPFLVWSSVQIGTALTKIVSIFKTQPNHRRSSSRGLTSKWRRSDVGAMSARQIGYHVVVST